MRTIVHIGLHSTGSTSIQYFLGRNRQKLNDLGISFYRGQYIENNHAELHVAAMRNERASGFKVRRGHVATDEYRDSVRSRVADFVNRTSGEIVLFSAEGLSLLRYRDEIGWLADLLPRPAEIVAVVREVNSYMASYATRLARQGLTANGDRESFAYVEKDSWLRDIEGRLAAFQPFFERVMALDYDRALANDGSVIPAFLRYMGVGDQFDRSEWEGVFLNVSAQKASLR